MTLVRAYRFLEARTIKLTAALVPLCPQHSGTHPARAVDWSAPLRYPRLWQQSRAR